MNSTQKGWQSIPPLIHVPAIVRWAQSAHQAFGHVGDFAHWIFKETKHCSTSSLFGFVLITVSNCNNDAIFSLAIPVYSSISSHVLSTMNRIKVSSASNGDDEASDSFKFHFFLSHLTLLSSLRRQHIYPVRINGNTVY